ncbi:MAG: AAA family ATPase, partial [Lachnospiraceae bacterium]|nr:AAA family ATPase [Lachnospiraceae bacterium]
MDRETLAEKKREMRPAEIVSWADSTGIESIDDDMSLCFAGWAYEKLKRREEALRCYKRAVTEFDDVVAVDSLFKLLRNGGEGASDELDALADSLEESFLSDEIMMLSRFEASRLRKDPIATQLELLKVYLIDFSNDEEYYVLYLELLLKNDEFDEAKRQLGRFERFFENTSYEERIDEVKNTLASGKKEKASKPEPHTNAKKPKEANRISTISLSELASSAAFKKTKKETAVAEQPPSIEERFEDIVGMQDARARLSNFYHVLKMQTERQDWNENFKPDMLKSTSFLITGGKGCGKTLLAVTIGSLLCDFGIRGAEEAVSVEAKEFIDNLNALNGLDDVTLIVENIERAKDQNGKFGDFSWKLLKYLREHKEKVSVIITGDRDSAEQLFGEETDILRELYMHIDIAPYSPDEMVEIFMKLADRSNWLLDEGAKALVAKRIPKEMKMATFAGGHSLNDKLNDAKARAAERFELLEDVEDEDMVTLRAVDFDSSRLKKDVDELIKKLDSLTGLLSVKAAVADELNGIITKQAAEEAGISRESNSGFRHMAFKGAPGTGKTTVARIIGEIYISLGLLPGNKEGLVECNSTDLVGQYIGEAQKLTTDMINRAMGGVLFIDEAYGLTQNQFGKEAITVLIKAMEDYRDSIIVIFAGYTREMDEFLDSNTGLRSRIGRHIVFEDYSSDELATIFRSMVKADKRILDKNVDDVLAELINSRSKAADFGNARGVRGILQQVEQAQDERISAIIRNGGVPGNNDYEIIRREDLLAVLNHKNAGSKDLDELLYDLNEMEGMEELKEVINRNVNAVKAAEKKKEVGIDSIVDIDSLHLIFKGGPGTGKTTVARKIGNIYKALGL